MDTKLIIVLILLITIYLLYYYKFNTNWIILLSILNIFIIVEILKDKDTFIDYNYNNSPLASNEFLNTSKEIDEMVIESIVDNDDDELLYSFIEFSQDESQIELTPQEKKLFHELHIEEKRLETCINKNCPLEVKDLFKNYNELFDEFKHENTHFNMTNFNITSFEDAIKNHVDKLNQSMNQYYLNQYKECVCSNRNCLTIINKIKIILENIHSLLQKSKNKKKALPEWMKKHFKYNSFILYTEGICIELEDETSNEYNALIGCLDRQNNSLNNSENKLDTIIKNYNNKLYNTYNDIEQEDDIIKINIIKITEEK